MGRGSQLVYGKISLASEGESITTLMKHLDDLLRVHGYPGGFHMSDLDKDAGIESPVSKEDVIEKARQAGVKVMVKEENAEVDDEEEDDEEEADDDGVDSDELVDEKDDWLAKIKKRGGA